MTVTEQDDQLLRRVARNNWLILAVLVSGSLLWQSPPVSLGVLAGGLLAILAHIWRYKALKKLLGIPGRGSRFGFQFSYILRLGFLAAAIYLLIVKAGIHPLALITGLSTVVINLLVTTVRRAF